MGDPTNTPAIDKPRKTSVTSTPVRKIGPERPYDQGPTGTPQKTGPTVRVMPGPSWAHLSGVTMPVLSRGGGQLNVQVCYYGLLIRVVPNSGTPTTEPVLLTQRLATLWP